MFRIGYRAVRDQRKESVRWTDGIKEAIDGKRRPYKKMLLRNVAEKIRVRRRTEYKSWIRKAKELLKIWYKAG